jgi:hypothetical protein
LATVGLLVLAPGNLQLEAAVYALADGPLAAALIVWQSAWVFGSPSHVIRCAVLTCGASVFNVSVFPFISPFKPRCLSGSAAMDLGTVCDVTEPVYSIAIAKPVRQQILTFVRSVLIHALPGMALLAHRYCPVPPTVLASINRFSPAAATWAGARTSVLEGSRAATESGLWWTAAAPLAFYAAWQLVYWLVVQVHAGCSSACHLLPE